MCWPSLRRLWMRILGINSPVAFFLTFTRYQYANVIYQFWSLSFGINSFSTWQLCLLTVILTDVHIHQRTKINPTKGKVGLRAFSSVQPARTCEFDIITDSATACQFRSGFYWTRTPIISYPGQFTTNMRQYWLPKSKLIASWLLKSLSWLSKQ